MDIRRLQFFLKIAEADSLSHASEFLRIGQPSLSRQMRLLEEELGVTLFVRHRRGMKLTFEGEELHERLKGPLRQVELALQEVRSLSKSASGTVVIGMPASIGAIFAGPLSRRVASSVPDIALQIVEGIAGNLRNSQARGEIDITLLQGPSADWLGTHETLLVEEICLVGPADWACPLGGTVEFGDLHTYPLIMPAPEYQPEFMRDILEKIRAVAGGEPLLGPVANGYRHTVGCVTAGLGYSFLPRSAVKRELMTGEVRCASIRNPSIMRELFMTSFPGTQFPRATSRVKDMIVQEIASMVASGEWPAKLGDTPA